MPSLREMEMAEDLSDVTLMIADCRAVAERAGQLAIDSKFEALLSFLHSREPSGKTVIVSQHPQTARYLSSQLESAERVRTASLEDLLAERTRSQNVIIVAYDSQLMGVELRKVDVAVHYDLPDDAQRLYMRLTRFVADPTASAPTIAYMPDETPTFPRQKRATAEFLELIGASE